MTGTAPVDTSDDADAARVRDGIHLLTAANASSKAARKLNRSATRVRILRVVAWIVLLAAAVWIAGSAAGYVTAHWRISAAMSALGIVAALVLVELRRRRNVAWY